MESQTISLVNLKIKPINVRLYVPPIVWKGDSIGHIGINDVFFMVVEGECFLSIDSQNYIIKPGQLAYLPKGKKRMYTSVSKSFRMYEMAFSAQINGLELMEVLNLTECDFVVDVPDCDYIKGLFESSNRDELFKDPLYDVAWCGNIINIIYAYAKERRKWEGSQSLFFKPVLEYMSQNMDKEIKLDELAGRVYMHPTYFVKKFKENFGLPPLNYLNRMRIYTAMGMLTSDNYSVEKIAKIVGITDASYFSRVFKKYCGVTPTEYKNAFKRRTVL